MKTNYFKIVGLLALLLVLFSHKSFSHYGPRGLTGGNVTCGIAHNGMVYLGTENAGVFVSTNTTVVAWRLRGVGLKSGKINAIMHSGEDLYTATTDSGVYIFNGVIGSDLFWNKRNSGLTNLNILSLAAVNGSVILAGSNGNGMFRSTNKGIAWTQVNYAPFNNSVITSIVRCGSRMIALVSNTGVYASDDGGINWYDFNDANTLNITNSRHLSYNSATNQLMLKNNNGLYVCSSASVVMTPTFILSETNLPMGTNIKNISNNGANWYLATMSGVFSTGTTSINWTAQNTGLATQSVNVVVAMQNTLVAGATWFGAYKSSVSPINWAQTNTGLTNIKTFAVACKADSLVATATDYGVVISKTLGLNPWIRNTGLNDSLNVTDLLFAGNSLYASTKNQGVYITNNLGLTWTQQNTGLTSMHITRLFFQNGRKYAIDNTGKVYQSDLMATSWTAIVGGLPMNTGARSMAFTGNYMFLGTYGNGVYKKHRDSTNWLAFNSGLTNMSVTAVTASDDKIFAGTDGAGVMRSNADVASWAVTSVITSTHFTYVPTGPNEFNRIQDMGSAKGYIVASFKSGLVASYDNGLTWERAGNQFNLPSYSDYNRIAFLPSRIFVTTENNSLQSNSMSELPIVDSIVKVNENIVNAPTSGFVNFHTITSNLSWTITSSDAWVIPSINTGTWNSSMSLQIAANTGTSRSATVTIKGEGTKSATVLVNQAANATFINSNTFDHSKFIVYPNPNNGVFNIQYDSEISITDLKVMDITGRTMNVDYQITENGVRVNSNLSTGVYFIQINSGNAKSIKRIVIQ